ncbi:hypothetical protein E2C01_061637 [Portunus trituberculatus]|uniref:Uncharacterized protein n=1 Tax=Portunus trituberculatus TaxID=210409 RepID=A0A5B7H5S6_PORTR|nr:hypothetical protein [Portunus trituberculatus]
MASAQKKHQKQSPGIHGKNQPGTEAPRTKRLPSLVWCAPEAVHNYSQPVKVWFLVNLQGYTQVQYIAWLIGTKNSRIQYFVRVVRSVQGKGMGGVGNSTHAIVANESMEEYTNV